MLEIEKREEHYEFKDAIGHFGTIIFRDCVFASCNYRGTGSVCTLNDWKFLGELSKEVLRLQLMYDEEGYK